MRQRSARGWPTSSCRSSNSCWAPAPPTLRDAAPNGILVAGGEHGDPEISIPSVLKRLTQLFMMRASVVLDISTADVTEQSAIIARFLDAMMKLPPDLHQPCLIMIDEVQNFAPERGRTRVSAAIVRVAKQGPQEGGWACRWSPSGFPTCRMA